MKKLLITLLLSLVTILGFGQDYPKYYVENGDTLGLVFTLEQAQTIDNDLDLLVLLEKSQLQCDSVNKQYAIVIEGLNGKIVILEDRIKNLNGQIVLKDGTINDLNTKVKHLQNELKLANEQISIKEEQNKNLSDEIGRQKFRKWIGYIGTGVSSIGIVLVAILLN